MGGGQGFWLQSLMSPLGFMLDLLQKLLWTILLSTFLLQPYRRYCFPTVEGHEEFQKRQSHKMHKGDLKVFSLLYCTSITGLGAIGPSFWSPLIGTVLYQHVVLNGKVTLHVHHVLIRQIHILISI